MLTPCCILTAAAAWWAAACGLSTYMWWLSLLLGEESLPVLLGLPAQQGPALRLLISNRQHAEPGRTT